MDCLKSLIVILLAFMLLHSVQGQRSCPRTFNIFGEQRVYSVCQNLGAQAATLAWTYFPGNQRLQIAFSGTAPSLRGWVGWGLNPTDWGMVGSSVLVAFQASNGSNVLPYKLTAAAEGGDRLVCSPVDLEILEKSVDISGTQMRIFATLQLKPGQTSLNMVWNRGAEVVNFSPQPHSLLPQDLRGFNTIDVW